MPVGHRRQRLVVGGRLDLLVALRKQHGDRRALARPGGDFGAAARLRGEAVDLRQAEAGALADVLGGEERFERAVEHVLRHAFAVVADRQADERLALVLDVGGRQGDRAAFAQRVARVEGGVEDRGLELRRVDFDDRAATP